ncbi:MAG TPA: ABC transporter substrate-binding protein [Candidatus Binatia bacterium]|nr:ABC transporter substrate-binding protein [Candidatus Binatia bacterium]
MGWAPRWSLVAMAVAAVLVGGGPAWAGVPTEQLRGRIDRVLKILDPESKQDGRSEERRAAIRKIAHETFDFREISQRSLARHWQGRTPAERDEFVQLFADVLERSYINQIEQYSGGEKIQYLGDAIDGDQAYVRTKIVTRQGTEVPVDYRMHKVGERWLVYDVSVEGVSLVSNYRAQFDRIIRSSSYKQLAEKLKAKKDEAREGDAVSVKRTSSSSSK